MKQEAFRSLLKKIIDYACISCLNKDFNGFRNDNNSDMLINIKFYKPFLLFIL